jgi:hypothetical protein
MTAHRTDPLLLAGKVLTIFIQGAMALGAAAIALAIPAVFLARAEYVTGIVNTGGVPIDKLPLGSLIGLLLLAFAVVAILFVFFGRLRAIIDTVGDGDPFIPDNARRLNLMAWLLLATQVLTLPMALLAAQVVEAAGKSDELKIAVTGDGFNLNGILTVLILFILARVFRIGAALREDLEGTV